MHHLLSVCILYVNSSFFFQRFCYLGSRLNLWKKNMMESRERMGNQDPSSNSNCCFSNNHLCYLRQVNKLFLGFLFPHLEYEKFGLGGRIIASRNQGDEAKMCDEVSGRHWGIVRLWPNWAVYAFSENIAITFLLFLFSSFPFFYSFPFIYSVGQAHKLGSPFSHYLRSRSVMSPLSTLDWTT